MSKRIELKTLSDLDRLLADPGAVLVFKHSTACPISAAAEERFEAWLAAQPADLRVARVLVIEARAVSNALAQRLGVTHASPQAILVQDGRALWNASHHAITQQALSAATQTSGGGRPA